MDMEPTLLDPEETEPLLADDQGEQAPKDKWNFVYIIFYMLGIGSLLPWNFFSNAKMYFMFKLRNVSDTDPEKWLNPDHFTDLQVMFESYLALAAMLPSVLFMLLNTAATKYIPLRIRIIIAMVAMILMFLLTIVLTKVNTDEWQMHFFIVTIITIIVMNAGSAVLQSGVFGLSSLFPKAYSQSVMGGMGLGGLVAAVSNLATIAIGSDPIESGFGYFVTGGIVIILALVGYLCLPFLGFAKYYMNMPDRPRSTSINKNNSAQSEDPTGDISMEISYGEGSSFLQVLNKIKMPGFCVFITFCITLSCYPAVNSAIQSAGYRVTPPEKPSLWASTYFMPVSCFLAFNLFDLFGRTLAGPLQWPRERSPLLLLFSLARVLFIPLFLICNIQPRYHIPVVILNDWAPILIMAFFAITNGYLGTLCMMYGPRRAVGENLEMAGSMMSFLLSLGLGMGAVFSILLVKIV